MALVDLVKITANTTGTGAIRFGSAIGGYRGVEALVDGTVYSYSIQQESDWELGRGTYLAATQAFVRSPLYSSVGGTAINLQPNAAVAIVALAEDLYDLAGAGTVDTQALANEVKRATSAEAYLATRIVAASIGIASYNTVAAMNADTSKLVGSFALVAENDTFYRYTSTGWVLDNAFRDALLSFVQPLADQAMAAATQATASAAEIRGIIVPLIVPGMSAGIIDKAGYVAGALGDDGLPIGATASNYAAFSDGNDLLVMTEDGRTAYAAYADGVNRSGTVNGNALEWVAGTAGSYTRRTKNLSLVPPVAAGVNRILHVPFHGQSNSFHWLAAALDGTALNPGRALMFVDPVGGPHLGAGFPPVSLVEPAVLVDLHGAPNERGGIGMRTAQRYLAAFGGDQAVVVSSHGVGGQAYANLKRGTVPYRNMLRALVEARLQALVANLAYLVPFSVWIHGEDNYGDSRATYLGYLNEYQADVQSDVAAISGSTFLPALLMAQPSSWTNYGASAATSGMPLAMVDAMRANPAKFCAVTAMYPFAYVTEGAVAVHLTQEGNRSLDTILGYVAARLVAAGGDATNQGGLYPISATRNGTSLSVSCRLPTGTTALAIKTGLVTDPGQYGLVYRTAGGANVPLTSIAVSGSTITATLATATAGTLGFATEGTPGAKAGPTTGPRCCICAPTGDTYPNGSPLDFYMLHSTVQVA